MDINEIARRAGVSRATISRYLNNGYVSKEKRDRIRRIIEETGYVPSQHARQLRTGKTHLVGVIMPKINSQSVSRMVAGITDPLASEGYQVILASTANDEHAEVDYLRLFAEHNRVDGIILIGTVLSAEHREVINDLRIPFVILGQHTSGIPCVYHDDYHAMFEIAKLVLGKSRRPAYLGVFERDIAAGKERHRGFVDACAEMGIDLDPQSQLVVDFDSDSGYFGAEKILDTIPDVDTIVCATDDIAFGALMCMREYGKRVPEDVQVTGVGDSLLSQITRPSLTTVHLFYKTSGVRAAQMLLAKIDGSEDGAQEIKMPYEVYGRMSMR